MVIEVILVSFLNFTPIIIISSLSSLSLSLSLSLALFFISSHQVRLRAVWLDPNSGVNREANDSWRQEARYDEIMRKKKIEKK